MVTWSLVSMLDRSSKNDVIKQSAHIVFDVWRVLFDVWYALFGIQSWYVMCREVLGDVRCMGFYSVCNVVFDL